MHLENPNIKQLLPMVASSQSKGLEAHLDGKSTYQTSAIETYCQEVFSRVAEIDNAFKNIDITLEYLSKKTYSDSNFNFSEHHAFHIENFLLRLTSVVDRSCLLAGSTLLMENSKIERLGGNKRIHEKLSSFSPKAFTILKRMEDAISHLRIPRNKVAHQSGYSNRNLGILQAIESATAESVLLSMITDIMSYDEIKDVVIVDSLEQFKSVAAVLDELVVELINSLSFVYSELIKVRQEITK